MGKTDFSNNNQTNDKKGTDLNLENILKTKRSKFSFEDTLPIQNKSSLLQHKRSSVFSMNKFQANSLDSPQYKDAFLNIEKSNRSGRYFGSTRNSSFKKCPLLPNGMWVHVPAEWLVTISRIMEVVDQALRDNDIKVIYQLQESEKAFYDEIAGMYLKQLSSESILNEPQKSTKLEDGVRDIVKFGSDVLSTNDLAVHYHLKNQELSHLLKMKQETCNNEERTSNQSLKSTLLGVLVEFVDSLITKPLKRKDNFKKKIKIKKTPNKKKTKNVLIKGNDGTTVQSTHEEIQLETQEEMQEALQDETKEETIYETQEETREGTRNHLRDGFHEGIFAIHSIKALLSSQSTAEKEESFIKMLKGKLAYNSDSHEDGPEVIKRHPSFRTEDDYDDSKYSEFSEKFCEKSLGQRSSNSDESINIEELVDEEISLETLMENREMDFETISRSSFSKFKEPLYETAVILRSSIRPTLLTEKFVEASIRLSNSISTTVIRSNSLIQSDRFIYGADTPVTTDDLIRVFETEHKSFFDKEMLLFQELLDPELFSKFEEREIHELISFRGSFQIRKFKNRLKRLKSIRVNLLKNKNHKKKSNFFPCFYEDKQYDETIKDGISKSTLLINRFQREAEQEAKCMSKIHKIKLRPMKNDITCKVCKVTIHNKTSRRQYREFYNNTLVRHERKSKSKTFGRLKNIENKPNELEENKVRFVHQNYPTKFYMKPFMTTPSSRVPQCGKIQKSSHTPKIDLLGELLRKVPKSTENSKPKIQISISAPLNSAISSPKVIFQPSSNRMLPIKTLYLPEIKEFIKLPLKSKKIHEVKSMNATVKKGKGYLDKAQTNHFRKLHKNQKLKTHDYETVKKCWCRKIGTTQKLGEIDDFHYSSARNSMKIDDFTEASNISNSSKLTVTVNEALENHIRSDNISNSRNTNFLIERKLVERPMKVNNLKGYREKNMKMIFSNFNTHRNRRKHSLVRMRLFVASEMSLNDNFVDTLNFSTVVEKDKAINILSKSVKKTKLKMGFNAVKYIECSKSKVTDKFPSRIIPVNFQQLNYDIPVIISKMGYQVRNCECIVHVKRKRVVFVPIFHYHREIMNEPVISKCFSHIYRTITERKALFDNLSLSKNPHDDNAVKCCIRIRKPSPTIEEKKERGNSFIVSPKKIEFFQNVKIISQDFLSGIALRYAMNRENSIDYFNKNLSDKNYKKTFGKIITVTPIERMLENRDISLENSVSISRIDEKNIFFSEIIVNESWKKELDRFQNSRFKLKLNWKKRDKVPHYTYITKEIHVGRELLQPLNIRITNQLKLSFGTCRKVDFGSDTIRESYNEDIENVVIQDVKRIISKDRKNRKPPGNSIAHLFGNFGMKINDNTDEKSLMSRFLNRIMERDLSFDNLMCIDNCFLNQYTKVRAEKIIIDEKIISFINEIATSSRNYPFEHEAVDSFLRKQIGQSITFSNKIFDDRLKPKTEKCTEWIINDESVDNFTVDNFEIHIQLGNEIEKCSLTNLKPDDRGFSFQILFPTLCSQKSLVKTPLIDSHFKLSDFIHIHPTQCSNSDSKVKLNHQLKMSVVLREDYRVMKTSEICFDKALQFKIKVNNSSLFAENSHNYFYEIINEDLRLLLENIAENKLIDLFKIHFPCKEIYALQRSKNKDDEINEALLKINEGVSDSHLLFECLQEAIHRKLEDVVKNTFNSRDSGKKSITNPKQQESFYGNVSNQSVHQAFNDLHVSMNSKFYVKSNLLIQVNDETITAFKKGLLKNSDFPINCKNLISLNILQCQRNNYDIVLNLSRENIQIIINFTVPIYTKDSSSIKSFFDDNIISERKNKKVYRVVLDESQDELMDIVNKSRSVEKYYRNRNDGPNVNQNHNFILDLQNPVKVSVEFKISKSISEKFFMKSIMKNNENKYDNQTLRVPTMTNKRKTKSLLSLLDSPQQSTSMQTSNDISMNSTKKKLKRRRGNCNSFYDINNTNNIKNNIHKRLKIINQMLSYFGIKRVKLSNYPRKLIIGCNVNHKRKPIQRNIFKENKNRIKLLGGGKEIEKMIITEEIELDNSYLINFNPSKSVKSDRLDPIVRYGDIIVENTIHSTTEPYNQDNCHQSIDINLLASKMDELKLEIKDQDQSVD